MWFGCYTDGFCYAIFDGHLKQIVKYHSFEVPDFYQVRSTTFQEFLDGIDVFINDFKSIKIVFENPFYTLMPAALFDEDEASSYFNLKYSLVETDQLLNQRIPDFGAQIIYSVQKHILNLLLSKFTESSIRERLKVYHHAHALLSGLYYQTNHLNTEVCYVNLCEKTFDVVLIKNSGLHFCNTYNFNNPVDVLYFVMHAYHSNQLNPEVYDCYVSGKNTHLMEIKALLFTYIKNIRDIELMHVPSPGIHSSTLFLLQHCV